MPNLQLGEVIAPSRFGKGQSVVQVDDLKRFWRVEHVELNEFAYRYNVHCIDALGRNAVFSDSEIVPLQIFDHATKRRMFNGESPIIAIGD